MYQPSKMPTKTYILPCAHISFKVCPSYKQLAPPPPEGARPQFGNLRQISCPFLRARPPQTPVSLQPVNATVIWLTQRVEKAARCWPVRHPHAFPICTHRVMNVDLATISAAILYSHAGHFAQSHGRVPANGCLHLRTPVPSNTISQTDKT
jgi:hypothetical protein